MASRILFISQDSLNISNKVEITAERCCSPNHYPRSKDMFRTQIEIFTSRSFGRIPRLPEDGYMVDDVTESVIQQIIEDKLIKRVQISDYIPDTVLEKLNRIFISRPDISFRVYGGADKTSG